MLLVLRKQHAYDWASVQVLKYPRERVPCDLFAIGSDSQRMQFQRFLGIEPRGIAVFLTAIGPAFGHLFGAKRPS